MFSTREKLGAYYHEQKNSYFGKIVKIRMMNDIGGKNPISKEGEGVFGVIPHLYPYQRKITITTYTYIYLQIY